jgi:c-di-GMP-binding flagellar brake protein YcgR
MNTSTMQAESNTEQYRVSERLEVAALLRGTIDRLIRLRAHSRQAAMTTTTCIIEVNPHANWMMFDRAPDAELAACIFASHELRFDSRIDNVLMEFTTQGATHAEYRGVPVWRAPLPQYVIRVQRREFHRQRAPVTRLPRCTLALETDTAATSYECELVDISAGGFAVNIASRDFPLAPSATYRCSLELKDLGVIETRAQLRTVGSLRHAWGMATRRCGFMFCDLLPAHQILVHRFLLALQRHRGLRGL